jgi:predicted lipoprotein with Yx(FWY)xxD motif
MFALAITLTAVAAVLVAVAQADASSQSRVHATTGAQVALRKTTLGTVLVDSRGRTLYLFEKDTNAMSRLSAAGVSYWPPLTSHSTPHAGKGVDQSKLGLTATRNGVGQVTYAGHPLYTFVGDKRAGQTSGEGLTNFGAGWYVLTANGKKVEESTSSSSNDSGSSGSSGGYGW